MWKYAQWHKDVTEPLLNWKVPTQGYREQSWASFYRGLEWRVVFDIGDMALVEADNSYILWIEEVR